MRPATLSCSACQKELDPNLQSVVYLGSETSGFGNRGPAIVLVLCPTTAEQLSEGMSSPCVATAAKLFAAANITPVPCTYEQWLSSLSLPQITDPKERNLAALISAWEKPRFA